MVKPQNIMDFQDHLVCPNSVLIFSDVTVFSKIAELVISGFDIVCFSGYYLIVNLQALILKVYLSSALINSLSLSSKAAPTM